MKKWIIVTKKDMCKAGCNDLSTVCYMVVVAPTEKDALKDFILHDDQGAIAQYVRNMLYYTDNADPDKFRKIRNKLQQIYDSFEFNLIDYRIVNEHMDDILYLLADAPPSLFQINELVYNQMYDNSEDTE